MQRNNPNNPQQRSRCAELLSNFPVVTLSITGICALFAFYTMAGDGKLSSFSISPIQVAQGYQFHRIVTSAFFHVSLLHIGMNMMSFFYLGQHLERLFGSFLYLYNIFLFILIGGVVHVGLGYLLLIVLRDASWVFTNSVGFSGVLFSLAVQESFLSTQRYRNVYGLFRVPTRVFPLVQLVLLQLLLPGISFLGHLSGLLVGFLHVCGVFGWLLPSLESVWAVEASNAFTRLRRVSVYCPAPTEEVKLPLGASLRDIAKDVYAMLSHCLYPLFVCVGRALQPLAPLGRRLRGCCSRRSSASDDSDDDGDGHQPQRGTATRGGYSAVPTADDATPAANNWGSGTVGTAGSLQHGDPGT